MGLDKNRLKDKILAILEHCRTYDAGDNPEDDAAKYFADQLAIAIVDEIKESDIVYQSGLTAPNGAVVGNFQGQLQ